MPQPARCSHPRAPTEAITGCARSLSPCEVLWRGVKSSCCALRLHPFQNIPKQKVASALWPRSLQPHGFGALYYSKQPPECAGWEVVEWRCTHRLCPRGTSSVHPWRLVPRAVGLLAGLPGPLQDARGAGGRVRRGCARVDGDGRLGDGFGHDAVHGEGRVEVGERDVDG